MLPFQDTLFSGSEHVCETTAVKKFFFIVLLFLGLSSQAQFQLKSVQVGSPTTGMLSTYKLNDLSFTKIHFAVVNKMKDFRTQSVEVQAHRWFGKHKWLSVLVGSVEDRKYGQKLYVSLWIKF